MTAILTSLVNLCWVGPLAARASGQNMTSSPLVCVPYKFLGFHGLLLGPQIKSQAKQQLGYAVGDEGRQKAQICFGTTQSLGYHAAQSVDTVEAECHSIALASHGQVYVRISVTVGTCIHPLTPLGLRPV